MKGGMVFSLSYSKWPQSLGCGLCERNDGGVGGKKGPAKTLEELNMKMQVQ